MVPVYHVYMNLLKHVSHILFSIIVIHIVVDVYLCEKNPDLFCNK